MMGSSEGRASRGGWGRMERVMGPLPEARRRVVVVCWFGEDIVEVFDFLDAELNLSAFVERELDLK